MEKTGGQFKEEFTVLQNQLVNGEIDRILFLDESMIRDYQAIQKTWFKKGKQKKIKTYGTHKGTKLIGSLDYETGEIFCIQEEQYTALEFQLFLERLLAKYPLQRLVVVLDNARIHHAKIIQKFVKENKSRLVLKFLPPYSPNLNPIEGFWKWMKASVINNVFFHTIQEIEAAVLGFIQERNRNKDSVLDRLCYWL